MKKSTLLLWSAAPLLLTAVLAGAAELAVRLQPARPAPPPEAFVTVLADERLFTLFAALNAAGYEDENFDMPWHPVRVTVREALAARPLPDLSRLRARLRLVPAYAFVEWALHFGQPPAWSRAVSGWEGSMPALLFFGLDAELRDFHRAAEVDALWRRVQPAYAAEAARYQAAAGTAIAETLAYVRMEAAPVGHIVIVPNLLDAHWRGYGPRIGGTAYVIVGPTGEQPDIGLVQHEALHSLVGSLVEANRGVIAADQADRLFARLRSEVDTGGYGTWPAMLEESVVNALGARLAAPEWRENALRNDEARGFWLTRPLAEKLADYEQGAMTLAEFMPVWLAALNDLDAAQLVR